jgi:peptidoglycan/xylan/chitin deacetylase (PgdA/CDA1 family)
MKFHVCWTIDCESCRKEINDVKLGWDAVAGFADILEKEGWAGTFFVMPEEIRPLANLLKRLVRSGHELGLHLHPDETGHPCGHLGAYSREIQQEIVRAALGTFEDCLGMRPASCRPGYASANDSTFPVLAECGIRQTSASMPGRRMTALVSNWAGAPLFAHYANPHNRLLTGGLNLVEIPISVDWETMIWGGVHPQDLRVEYTDAKNHRFAIEKIMQRQVQEDLPLKALVAFTHNLFRYCDAGNFRRETMIGMNQAIRHCADELGIEVVGTTIANAAAAYRATVPFEQVGTDCANH